MSTSKEISTNHITKFNGINFPLWKLSLWVVFKHHKLVNIVTGVETIPVEVTK